MTIVTEDGGRTNMYAKEPPIRVQEVTVTHNEIAEKLNGRLAMLGVIAAIGAYAFSGQLIPGIWWWFTLTSPVGFTLDPLLCGHFYIGNFVIFIEVIFATN